MKKCALIILFVGAMLIVLLGYTMEVKAGVPIPPPPPFVFPASPSVFLIPNTYVYFVPDIGPEIFFYHGYWYRPHKGYWYRATVYNGPWVYIAPARVPVVFLNLPPNFRTVPPGHKHITHGELKKNWRYWERERYWDRPHGHERRERKREERREHREGRDR
jgi:hypothetical protein